MKSMMNLMMVEQELVFREVLFRENRRRRRRRHLLKKLICSILMMMFLLLRLRRMERVRLWNRVKMMTLMISKVPLEQVQRVQVPNQRLPCLRYSIHPHFNPILFDLLSQASHLPQLSQDWGSRLHHFNNPPALQIFKLHSEASLPPQQHQQYQHQQRQTTSQITFLNPLPQPYSLPLFL